MFRADSAVYLLPVGLVFGATAEVALDLGQARSLFGGTLAFTACEVIVRQEESVTSTVLAVNAIQQWATHAGIIKEIDHCLDCLSASLQPFAGLPLAQPRLMGVVNTSPDSFLDGSAFANPHLAFLHAMRLKEAGADIIDVGGESTRPGAWPITLAEEIERVVPVIQALAGRGILISIDTSHAVVMAAALDAGATIINDVTALTGDPESLPLLAARKAPVILMHMQGEPRTMQNSPQYRLAPLDIYDFLAERISTCLRTGIARADICLDPGIGFGKTVAHNLEIMSRLAVLHTLGCGLLLGASRKSFIACISASEAPQARLPGSLAAAMAGLDQGVSILRVHDIAETRQLISVWQAIRSGALEKELSQP